MKESGFMTYKAVVKNGAAILPPDADVPDGTEVEVHIARRTTLGELLKFAGTWHGDDADEVVEMIYKSRSSRPVPQLD